MPRPLAYQAGGQVGRKEPKFFELSALDFQLAVEVVALFAVLGKVEPGGFLFGAESQAHHLVHEEEQNKSAGDGNAPGDANASQLVKDLAPVAIDGPGGDGVPRGVLSEDGIDGRGSEEPRKDCAQRAPGAPRPVV